MKKIFALLMAAVMMVSMTACGQEETVKEESSDVTVEESVAEESTVEESSEAEESSEVQESSEAEEETYEKVDVKIAALKGPTALGMLSMMKDAEADAAPDNYEFTLAGSPDEILGNIIKGEFDIAAVPTNVAAVLYNKTEGQVQIGSLNTLGVLYCVEIGDTVNSVEDLKGQTVYSLGKGSTPEFALNYILRQNGVDPENDLTIEYKSEASEVAALMANGEGTIAMLPQPFVTSLLAQNPDVRVALDITEEWDKVGEGSNITMGCVVIQKAFIEENPEAVERFLEAYEASVAFTNGEDTIATAAQYAEEFGIIAKAAVAQKAIPECNIVFVEGAEMKTIAEGFLQVLFEADPAAVGGAVPAADFYYNAE